MRRRTKPRVVWLPPDLGNSIVTEPTSGFQSIVIPVTGAGGGSTGIGEIPVTIDAPPDPTVSTLSDMENSSYRLRRIVGKVFVFGDAFDEESGIELLAVTAALMVRRVSEAGTSLASQADLEAVKPGVAANWPDPWIWRRTWLIRGVETVFSLNFPFANWEYGSAVDGPHVDQKTARIVGPEERLFLDVGAMSVAGGGQGELSNDISVITDLRVLATMRASSGNRSNASR